MYIATCTVIYSAFKAVSSAVWSEKYIFVQLLCLQVVNALLWSNYKYMLLTRLLALAESIVLTRVQRKDRSACPDTRP